MKSEPEVVEESTQAKKIRACWKNQAIVKTFLEACIHQAAIHGRDGSSLKPNGWKNVAKTLAETHNFILTQRQMKNHFDYIKSKYNLWVKLKNKTGNVYDPVANTFNLSEEEWKIEIQKNKIAEKLRAVALLFPDLCVQLFDGVQCVGIGTWGPSTKVPNPSRVNPENKEGIGSPASTQPISSADDCQSRPPKKQKIKSPGATKAVDLDDVVKHVKKAFENDVEDDDMGACFDKLEKLGWEQSPLYEVVLFLFSQGADYRKLWLKLKDERCEAWANFTARQLKML